MQGKSTDEGKQEAEPTAQREKEAGTGGIASKVRALTATTIDVRSDSLVIFRNRVGLSSIRRDMDQTRSSMVGSGIWVNLNAIS